MSTIFFVSSAGDTDLAKATINEMLIKGAQQLWVVPLTPMAQKRVEGLNSAVTVKKLQELLVSNTMPTSITPQHIAKINVFIKENSIEQAYVGVPSPVNEMLPYLLASKLSIPCVVANEFMYKDETHPFWHQIHKMTENGARYAVPTSIAKDQMDQFNSKAKVNVIGHLCIDKAINKQVLDTAEMDNLKKKLQLLPDSDYIFVSGTTQPEKVDQLFLQALLKELATGRYPNLHLRFGIHPGVKHMDGYLAGLLKVCRAYQNLSNQFKIIISPAIEAKLDMMKCVQSEFVLRTDISGPDAASAADKVTQAVPGALLNEAVMLGKPGYSHKPIKAYLPSGFSLSIDSFFTAKRSQKKTLEELGLKDSAPENLAKLLIKR